MAKAQFMQYEHFDCEVRDGVAYLHLIGPSQPALGPLCDEYIDLMLRLQEDQAARVILMTDGDHAFELRRNIDGIAQARSGGRGFEAVSAQMDAARRVITLIEELEKPVVTATRGAIRSAGLGLFLASDVRIASSTATFTPPDLSCGLLPDWGLTAVLPQLIGPGRALDLLWSGRTLGAAEAGAIGLVDRIFEDSVWESELGEYMARLSQLPQPAFRLTKLAVQQAPQFDLTAMLSYEYEAQQQCWDSQETSEGLLARQEGRLPLLHAPLAEEEEDG